MKKRLSIIVRLLLAVLGIGYIVYTVNWTDGVELREHIEGQPAPLKHYMPVVEGDMDARNQIETLVVVDKRTNPPTRITLTPDELRDSDRYILRPGFFSTLGHANVGLLLLGFALVSFTYPLQAWRWLILMRCQGLDVGYGKAMKLTMVGSFFNFCMPGSTGGDVIKAYYAAARSERRTVAIMSVIFDRIAGLLGLVILGGVVGLFSLDIPLVRHITLYVWIGAGVFLLCASIYFSRRARKSLGLDWVISKLPMQGLFKRVDEAAVSYRDSKKAVVASIALSVPVHIALTSATAVAGYALGMDTRFGLLMTVIPVIFLSGAVPITPQGAGVWEAIAGAMLVAPPAVTINQCVAMLVMIRLYQLAYSLSGSVFLLTGDVHMHPERAEATAPESDPATAA
jgi:uncharacterized protein (TIRG00374 family)